MGKAYAALILVMAVGIMWPPIASAQLACDFQLATAGGQALTCPLGGVRNIVDLEGGTESYHPDGTLDRPKLDLNISSGEAVDDRTGELVRSRLALNPDVGGPGTVIFDGRKNRIASFYPDSIEFYAPVVFHQGVATQAAPPRLDRLRRRVALLERRVKRIRSVLRRLYR